MTKLQLSLLYPELAKEWHPTKNQNLKFDGFYASSDVKVWWKCPKGDDHEWMASIVSRIYSKLGCPICSRRKTVLSNCLATTHPDIAKQWHQKKNGKLTPFDVVAGSNKKVWWKCPKGEDHEWISTINDRTNNHGCPVCTGRKVVLSNSLATTHPELAKQWHPNKNGTLTPYLVTAGSNKKVWWKCPNGNDHIYQQVIYEKCIGKGCPICSNQKVVLSNCLVTTHPELAKQWHPTKNGTLTPYDIVAGSTVRVWWKCPNGDDHEWISQPNNRVNQNQGCPVCSNQKVVLSNCLATTHPDIARQWHPTKNRKLTPFDVVAGSTKKVWWKCPNKDDHEYRQAIVNKKYGQGCPMCLNKTVVKSNCLATTNPEIAHYWHPTKNGTLTPFDVIAGSQRKVWWKCPKGDDHEWYGKIVERKRFGCPICAGKIVVASTCLATNYPEIAEEWHPSKNGKLTPYDVTVGSRKKVWWKCPKGDDHEWEATIGDRTNNHGCPVCANQKVKLSNCLATTHPHLVDEWDYRRNGKNIPWSVTAGSDKKVSWICRFDKRHIWRTNIKKRALRGDECPFCSLKPQSKQELTILFELKKLFSKIKPEGEKLKLNNKIYSVDIFIPEINLVIEFDGLYWHEEKEKLDLKKTNDLINNGFSVIRIRELPLNKITPLDLVFSRPIKLKQTVNDLLITIKSNSPLNKILLEQFESYIQKEVLQNQIEMEEYINKILTGKAEKRNRANHIKKN